MWIPNNHFNVFLIELLSIFSESQYNCWWFPIPHGVGVQGIGSPPGSIPFPWSSWHQTSTPSSSTQFDTIHKILNYMANIPTKRSPIVCANKSKFSIQHMKMTNCKYHEYVTPRTGGLKSPFIVLIYELNKGKQSWHAPSCHEWLLASRSASLWKVHDFCGSFDGVFFGCSHARCISFGVYCATMWKSDECIEGLYIFLQVVQHAYLLLGLFVKYSANCWFLMTLNLDK